VGFVSLCELILVPAKGRAGQIRPEVFLPGQLHARLFTTDAQPAPAQAGGDLRCCTFMPRTARTARPRAGGGRPRRKEAGGGRPQAGGWATEDRGRTDYYSLAADMALRVAKPLRGGQVEENGLSHGFVRKSRSF
jgi:hypothetical protein